METRVLDDLLSDLTEEFNFPNIERFRFRVNDHMRTVFRNIGYDLIASEFTEKMPVAQHTLTTPSYVLKVEDLSLDGQQWAGYEVTTEMYPKALLAFKRTPVGLQLPNYPAGDLYVRYIGLLKDERGQALIHREAYAACYEFVLGKLLESHPLHPRYNDRYRVQQNADTLIAQTRAELNRETAATRRTERQASGFIRNQTNDRFFY
ncbi:hypothetical protein [Spirosoma sordidisoli]|uniref:Uncharacterized protein n=1 Tax=Spirosoma sordidisoli TaxID=2502893 RepID=A0A4Q2UMQ9_9BACT|nr:hypothetical protein [Spirosoma sordidisoli]RYC70684.1 hypothetical protein EQG79_00600 [Spirosoma sordidisoli]